MRRSKLETSLCILEVLNNRGPLKITHLMQKADLNYNALEEQLDFLIRQSMIEERVVDKGKIVYAIAPRGVKLLRFFVNLHPTVPKLEANIRNPAIKDKKGTFHNQNSLNC